MIKNLRKRCKNKKGFTMVELIVVIVIILVLTALLVPSVLKYIERANIANCKADAATLLVECQAELAEVASTGGAVSTTTYVHTGVTYTLGIGDETSEVATFTYANGDYSAVYTKANAGNEWIVNKGATQVWPATP